MAFTDNFDRASLTGWTTVSGCTALSTKSSIKCMADNDPEASYYSDNSPSGANYYSQVTLLTPITSTSGKGMGPAVRINSGSAGNMIFCQCNSNASERMQIWRVTSGGGVYTNIGGSTAVTPAAGDVAKLSINGTALTFSLNGVDRISLTESTLTAAGTWGIFGAADAGEVYVDDWEGGDIGAAVPASMLCLLGCG